jgi:hypothetical protein
MFRKIFGQWHQKFCGDQRDITDLTLSRWNLLFAIGGEHSANTKVGQEDYVGT